MKNNKDIILKLKKQGLLGKSGSAFPTWIKWDSVKKSKAKKKYIICNASEGEPGIFKDKFILKFYPEEVVEGLKIALETINRSEVIVYFKKDYYPKFKEKLDKLTKGMPVTFFKKSGGYLCGEETVLMNAIEGKGFRPRIKPPFPNQAGLYGFPTLINNVETFYCISKIAKGEYKNTRFFSITGDVKKRGVFELPIEMPIKEILKKTGNWPDFDFFVQSCGGASGGILLPRELGGSVGGLGGIIVFNRKKTDPMALMVKWAKFFLRENCDKCVPCREGVYRVKEIIKKEKIDMKLLEDLFFVMEETSLCGLGKIVPVSFRSLINKLL